MPTTSASKRRRKQTPITKDVIQAPSGSSHRQHESMSPVMMAAAALMITADALAESLPLDAPPQLAAKSAPPPVSASTSSLNGLSLAQERAILLAHRRLEVQSHKCLCPNGYSTSYYHPSSDPITAYDPWTLPIVITTKTTTSASLMRNKGKAPAVGSSSTLNKGDEVVGDAPTTTASAVSAASLEFRSMADFALRFKVGQRIKTRHQSGVEKDEENLLSTIKVSGRPNASNTALSGGGSGSGDNSKWSELTPSVCIVGDPFHLTPMWCHQQDNCKEPPAQGRIYKEETSTAIGTSEPSVVSKADSTQPLLDTTNAVELLISRTECVKPPAAEQLQDASVPSIVESIIAQNEESEEERSTAAVTVVNSVKKKSKKKNGDGEMARATNKHKQNVMRDSLMDKKQVKRSSGMRGIKRKLTT